MSGKDPLVIAEIARIIAKELGVGEGQVAAAIQLIEEGATVPFIARYRKERTGGLDDTQLRTLAERLDYLTALADRRDVVLKSIREQGKLTPELEKQILACMNKVELEDLYLPYRPKRRTKASIAREAGLEPLADRLLANPGLDPVAEAMKYISADKGVADSEAALEGARNILIERMVEAPAAEHPPRHHVGEQGQGPAEDHTEERVVRGPARGLGALQGGDADDRQSRDHDRKDQARATQAEQGEAGRRGKRPQDGPRGSARGGRSRTIERIPRPARWAERSTARATVGGSVPWTLR